MQDEIEQVKHIIEEHTAIRERSQVRDLYGLIRFHGSEAVHGPTHILALEL